MKAQVPGASILLTLNRLSHSPLPRLAAVTLVVLVWSNLAFCGEIHDAARSGDLAKVQALLLENPALVSSRDTNGWTPLLVAAASGHKDVAELLLVNKADVSAMGNRGQSAMQLAAQNGHADVAELLLAHGADVNATNGRGESPLDWAAYNGEKDSVEFLLANKADIHARDSRGRTPLHFAAENNQKDMVELLLAHGADVKAPDDRGQTPLHWAALLGRKDAVEALLAHGADANARSGNGSTPLDLAVSGNHPDVEELLQSAMVANTPTHAAVSVPAPPNAEAPRASPPKVANTPAATKTDGKRTDSSCGPDQVKFNVKTEKEGPQAGPLDAGKARVYFIEDDSGYRVHPKPTTRLGVDGEWVGATHGNSYFYISVDPGVHSLCARQQFAVNIGHDRNVGTAYLNAEAQVTYYFSVSYTQNTNPLLNQSTTAIGLEPLKSHLGQSLAQHYAFSTFEQKK